MNPLLPPLRIDVSSSPVSSTGEERGPSAVALAKAYGIGEGAPFSHFSFAFPHFPHASHGSPSSPVEETGEEYSGHFPCFS